MNVLGTVRLLAAAATAGVPRFVIASSAAVYGDPTVFLTVEAEPHRPLSPYGIAKSAAERYLESLRATGAHRRGAAVRERLRAPADRLGEAGVVAVFCRRPRRCPLTIHGDGRQTRDFVHVADVVAACLAALGAPSGAWHVATGVESDILTVAAELRRHLAPEARIVHAAPRPADPRRSVLSPDLAAGQLGFRARIPLAAGLERTAGWFRSHPEGNVR